MIVQDTIDILKNLSAEKGTKVRFYENGSPGFLALTDLIVEGNTVQITDEAFDAELLSWIRHTKNQKDKLRNGLTNEVMGTPSAPAFIGKPIASSFLKPEKQHKTDMKIPFKDRNGHPLEGSISEKTFISIGGVRQGMFIKSKNKGNPVLLYVIPYRYLKLRDETLHSLGIGTTRDMNSIITGVFIPSLTCREYTLKEKFNLNAFKL